MPDFDIKQPSRLRRVLKTISTVVNRLVLVTVISGGTTASFEATPEHSVGLSTGQFVPVSELTTNDCLQMQNGGCAQVVSLSPRTGSFPVYDLEVEEDHTFGITRLGIVVHNTGHGACDFVEWLVGGAKGVVSTEIFNKRLLLFRKYLKEIKEITGLEVHSKQLSNLKEAVRSTEYKYVSSTYSKKQRLQFNKLRNNLIKQWEVNTGRTWPKYTENVYNNGKLVQKKGDLYDAHHIIESSYGGPHEWWNLHPAHVLNHRGRGIHAAESAASEIFKLK